jgi:hypothetical protein
VAPTPTSGAPGTTAEPRNSGRSNGPEETVEDLVAAYRETVRRANEVIESYTDLTLPAPTPPGKQPSSMRWLLVHMIEETGRHAGHADILREQIDGATGR